MGWDLDGRWGALNTKFDPGVDVGPIHEPMLQSLRNEFGLDQFEAKLRNYNEMGPMPFSVLAFHNKFLHAIRNAFVIGSYYPALVASCTLGERILNHLWRALKREHELPERFKKTKNKEALAKWDIMIDILKEWRVIPDQVARDFRELEQLRQQAVHFDPKVDHEDRRLALKAIKKIQEIVQEQFSGWGAQPWFITGIAGELYIKKEWESKPFIRLVYVPNGYYAGPKNRIISMAPFSYEDPPYVGGEITDDEFVRLRLEYKESIKA